MYIELFFTALIAVISIPTGIVKARAEAYKKHATVCGVIKSGDGMMVRPPPPALTPGPLHRVPPLFSMLPAGKPQECSPSLHLRFTRVVRVVQCNVLELKMNVDELMCRAGMEKNAAHYISQTSKVEPIAPS